MLPASTQSWEKVVSGGGGEVGGAYGVQWCGGCGGVGVGVGGVGVGGVVFCVGGVGVVGCGGNVDGMELW